MLTYIVQDKILVVLDSDMCLRILLILSVLGCAGNFIIDVLGKKWLTKFRIQKASMVFKMK